MTSNLIAMTGRVKTYLESPEKGTMPVSCTVYEYDNDLFAAMKYVDIALRGGAGINVILDKFVASAPIEDVEWYFELNDRHTDAASIPQHLKPLQTVGYSLDMSYTDKDVEKIKVADSMEESTYYLCSIQQSWSEFYYALTNNKIAVVDVNRLRPNGSTNSKGLVASGAASFLGVYDAIAEYVRMGDIKSLMNVFGAMNDVLRRGGAMKNGICTFSLTYKHPDVIKYLNIPLSELKGSAKKKIRLDEVIIESDRLMKLVALRVNDKSLMIEKIQPNGLLSNVCVEILLANKGTCLIGHINLGQVESFDQIPQAMVETTELLISIFQSWQRHPQYLDGDSDRQIGIGFVGLANLLARFKVRYRDFVNALEYRIGIHYHADNNDAVEIVDALIEGYAKSSLIVKAANLDRAWTIAPTQTSAYNHQDLDGNTTSKNINPPLKRRVQRQSQVMDSMNKWYYHGKVETMAEFLESMPIDPVTGKDGVQRLWEAWQMMMDNTGLAHTMSFDLYRKIDVAWLKDFILNSPLQTTYYMLADQVDQSHLNKGLALTASDKDQCAIDNQEGCIACAE